MISDNLIHCLDGMRETGHNRWIARCPAHEDRSPSLAVREVDDRVLVHCFAGCSADEIVSAAGLEISDLFPPRSSNSKPLSKPFPAADILRCLRAEITFLVICADDLSQGKKLDQEDMDRLLLSSSRFRSALTAGGLA